MVVLFNRTQVVGASSMHSGLFYSTNDGATWEHTGWNNVRAFGMAADGDQLWLAAGNGIHRSTNEGASWKVVTDWRITEALHIAVDTNHHMLYSATAHGVWCSTDGGESWSQHNSGLKSTFTDPILFDASRNQVLTATEEALYCSTDHGTHWQRSEDSVTCGTAILDLQQATSDPNVIFASSEDRGVLRSRDGGMHWTLASNGLLRTAYYALAIDPLDARTVFATGLNSGIWKTTNAGAQWNEVGGDSLSRKNFHGLAISRMTPGLVFAGEYNGGVWRSQDFGSSWTKIGLDSSQVWQMVVR